MVVAFGVGLRGAAGEGAMKRAEPGWTPLPGRVTGILVRAAGRMMSEQGYSGPEDVYGFASGTGGYRRVYVRCPGGEFADEAGPLTVRVGEAGSGEKTFDQVCLLDAAVAAHLDKALSRAYTLVEVEVNGGLGCPATDSFVATDLRVIPGPFDPTRAVEAARKRFLTRVEEVKAKGAMARAFHEAAKSSAADGMGEPKEVDQHVTVTWLPDRKVLRTDWRLEYRAPSGRPETNIGIQASPPGGRPTKGSRRPAEEYSVSLAMEFEFAQGHAPSRVGPLKIRSEVRRTPRAK
jgi:hypothetical protein